MIFAITSVTFILDMETRNSFHSYNNGIHGEPEWKTPAGDELKDSKFNIYTNTYIKYINLKLV